ncbi:MAG: RNA polymerase sigma factor [Acidiferrobacterales bacterium]|nr:RNA polymerase sigma factor [Acidiferrobacterales bacterium]
MIKNIKDRSNQHSESVVTPVFIKNQSFLKRFLTRFLSSSQDIEDVVQESYLKALGAEQKHEISSPKAFLFRIARNEALKQLQKKSRRITDYLDDIDVPEGATSDTLVEDSSITKQRFGLFCQSTMDMPPRCRKAFLMCKVYGFSYKEIASHLGISVSGVEKHIARGLEICNAYVDKIEAAENQQRETTKKSAQYYSRPVTTLKHK